MISDANLLSAWERAYNRPPFEQALVLLGCALPGARPEQLLAMSLGERDRNLMMLRRRLFGSAVESIAECPDCQTQLEFGFAIDDVLGPEAAPAAQQRQLIGRFDAEFRAPCSSDLIAVANQEPVDAANALLQRCVLRLTRDDQAAELDQLSPPEMAELQEQLTEADPLADVQMQLSCAECSCEWTSAFDVVSFLWTELNDWCQRLLAEVHLLARSYGWTEQQTLALSRWRRQIYLGMVRQ